MRACVYSCMDVHTTVRHTHTQMSDLRYDEYEIHLYLFVCACAVYHSCLCTHDVDMLMSLILVHVCMHACPFAKIWSIHVHVHEWCSFIDTVSYGHYYLLFLPSLGCSNGCV